MITAESAGTSSVPSITAGTERWWSSTLTTPDRTAAVASITDRNVPMPHADRGGRAATRSVLAIGKTDAETATNGTSRHSPIAPGRTSMETPRASTATISDRVTHRPP